MKDQVEEVKVVDDVPLAPVASDHYPVMIKIKRISNCRSAGLR